MDSSAIANFGNSMKEKRKKISDSNIVTPGPQTAKPKAAGKCPKPAEHPEALQWAGSLTAEEATMHIYCGSVLINSSLVLTHFMPTTDKETEAQMGKVPARGAQ